MRNWPIIKTVSAAAGSVGFVAVIELARVETPVFSAPLSLVACLLAGVLYTQLVEHWYHRVPMHRGLRFLRLSEEIKRAHSEHHRIFHGERFQTRDADALLHVTGRYWVFPLFFFAHYAILIALVPAPFLLAFLGGAALHYIAFEITHWFTHVAENGFDGAIAHVPVLSALRERQVSHHRWHHEFPEEAFNFMPPYLGDWLTSGEGARAEDPPPVVPIDAPDQLPIPTTAAALVRAWSRPLVRYGTVAAVGVVAIGVAVLAHGRWSGRGVAVKAPPTPSELSI